MTELPTRYSHRTEPSPEDLQLLRAEHAREMGSRAEIAGRSIIRRFGRKAFSVPGTLIGAVQVPDPRGRRTRLTSWHFWWQAHLLDCAVDASLRAHYSYDTRNSMRWFELAQQILRGIKTRNFGVYTNTFYDDMAWLTLAAGRLNALSELLRGRGETSAQDAGSALYQALEKGATSDLGGGVFWSTRRDFKNTPATAPTALAFVRGHRVGQASALLDWLDEYLWDAQRQVYLDGLVLRGGTVELAEGMFTYNQGPVLSAMVEAVQAGASLGFDVPSRVDAVLDGIERHFVADFELSAIETLRVLKTQGDGDGGLFTGILARYLGQVALSDGLPEKLRECAGNLVVHTAEVLWEGRREFDPDLPLNEPGVDVREIRGEPAVLFSTDVVKHSSETLPPAVPVELSPQLQAWMVLEAAARVLAEG